LSPPDKLAASQTNDAFTEKRLESQLPLAGSSCQRDHETHMGADGEAVGAISKGRRDLGHPPFGHIAEEELNDLAGTNIDGFEGNAQRHRHDDEVHAFG
jgi:hypothetical protein